MKTVAMVADGRVVFSLYLAIYHSGYIQIESTLYLCLQ